VVVVRSFSEFWLQFIWPLASCSHHLINCRTIRRDIWGVIIEVVCLNLSYTESWKSLKERDIKQHMFALLTTFNSFCWKHYFELKLWLFLPTYLLELWITDDFWEISGLTWPEQVSKWLLFENVVKTSHGTRVLWTSLGITAPCNLNVVVTLLSEITCWYVILFVKYKLSMKRVIKYCNSLIWVCRQFVSILNYRFVHSQQYHWMLTLFWCNELKDWLWNGIWYKQTHKL
jgi:hypothetical protein